MAAAQAMAVGVSEALDHVAGARNGVAGFEVKTRRKVSALRGAMELPTGDACEQSGGGVSCR